MLKPMHPFRAASIERLLAIVALGLTAGFAHAAEPEAASEVELEEATLRGESALESGEFDRVSSFRLAGPIAEIPRNIAVIPESLIERQSAEDMTDVVLYDASTQPGDNYLARFQVRGFDASLLTDGVPIADFANNTFFNETVYTERVEILKGPASLRYGSLKPGGTVNRVTKKPQDERFAEIGGSTGFGADGQELYEARGDWTGAILPDAGLSGRVIGLVRERESFRDFIDQEEYVFAPSLAWRPQEATEFLLQAVIEEEDGFLDRGIPAAPAIGAASADGDGIAPVDATTNLQEPDDDFENEHLSLTLTGTHEPREGLTASLQGFYQDFEETRESTDFFGIGTRNSLTGFVFPSDLAPGEVGRFHTDQFSQNELLGLRGDLTVEFETGGLIHELTGGFDWRHEEEDFDSAVTIAQDISLTNPIHGQPLAPFVVADLRDRELQQYGFYLRDQIRLMDDRLLVNAGLRYDRADLGFSGFTDFPAPANTDFDFDDSQLSPSGGAVFDVTDGWSVYASYAESFQAPDPANGDIVGGEPPESELAEQWEAGLRWAPSEKWQATLAYFDITKENIVTGDVFGNSQQIGEQFSRGVEFQFTGKPAKGLDLLFGVTWTDAEVEEGRGTNPVTGATEDLSGRDLAGIPEWAASAAAQYGFDENSPLAGFSVGAGAFYRGNREGDNFGTFELDDYVRIDVNAAYRAERFDARLTIRNIFDEDYFQTANTTVSALPGAPIFAELSLNFRF